VNGGRSTEAVNAAVAKRRGVAGSSYSRAHEKTRDGIQSQHVPRVVVGVLRRATAAVRTATVVRQDHWPGTLAKGARGIAAIAPRSVPNVDNKHAVTLLGRRSCAEKVEASCQKSRGGSESALEEVKAESLSLRCTVGTSTAAGESSKTCLAGVRKGERGTPKRLRKLLAGGGDRRGGLAAASVVGQADGGVVVGGVKGNCNYTCFVSGMSWGRGKHRCAEGGHASVSRINGGVEGTQGVKKT
jgi:hypothetical protein